MHLRKYEEYIHYFFSAKKPAKNCCKIAAVFRRKLHYFSYINNLGLRLSSLMSPHLQSSEENKHFSFSMKGTNTLRVMKWYCSDEHHTSAYE